MSIRALINEDLIDLHLHGSNQLNVIEQMASMLERQGRIESKSIFTECVLEREAQVTTGFGNGIAIPHGKDETVKDTSISIGKLSNSVDWKAMDDRDVSFVIMLAIPESEAGTTHLQILSQLSGKLMDEDFRDSLMKANEKEDVLNLLSDCITEKNIG
ncbi:PTS mannose transporter subunit IIAB [Thalassobacillus devorans]|uniref:PTS mannose transporter subunit IIAB n=1 Tax=Thalassobacillus devorans TaxID=279813 RepID=A0ABQ1P2T7_9BACI|nr:PTS sugar transporter subunit IIA [Thalassobacillus devorans]NIK28004.1 fructose-specific phosphotransferase system IIA component [Thalassobacillus devorans]GGC89682.1 PTS mannose transporter subunit IIAB [Thalassobacillus devorans]